MIRINLLPVRTSRKRETALRQLFLAGVGLALVGGGVAYAHLGISEEVETAQRRNTELDAEIADLKKQIGQVEEFEKKKEALQKKLDIIKTLKSRKTGPVHMLDEIAIRVPEKVWITSISEANKKVTLTGAAINNEVIADFITSLDESQYFEDVYLVSTQQSNKKATLKLKDFSLTARMISPEEKKAKVQTIGAEIEAEEGG